MDAKLSDDQVAAIRHRALSGYDAAIMALNYARTDVGALLRWIDELLTRVEKVEAQLVQQQELTNYYKNIQERNEARLLRQQERLDYVKKLVHAQNYGSTSVTPRTIPAAPATPATHVQERDEMPSPPHETSRIIIPGNFNVAQLQHTVHLVRREYGRVPTQILTHYENNRVEKDKETSFACDGIILVPIIEVRWLPIGWYAIEYRTPLEHRPLSYTIG